MECDAEKLVLLIKIRKPLYDYNMKEYSNKSITDKLWEEVAEEMNSTVVECKSKWTSLRNSYARTLRELNKLPPGARKKKKIWYLADTMSFLSEFMGHHKRKFGSNPDEGPFAENMEDLLSENEDSLQETKVNTCDNIPDDLHINKTNQQFKKPKLEKKEVADADLLFFKSLLPDIKKLSGRRKRKFKETIMMILNNLLDSEEEETHGSHYVSPVQHINSSPYHTLPQVQTATTFGNLMKVKSSPGRCSSDSNSEYC